MEGLNNFKTGEVPILWGGGGVYILVTPKKNLLY